MRNLLALIGFAVVLFLGVGYARGWYDFEFVTDSNGRVKVSGDIDGKKIKEDGNTGLEKAGNAINNLTHKNGSASQAPATLPVAKP